MLYVALLMCLFVLCVVAILLLNVMDVWWCYVG